MSKDTTHTYLHLHASRHADLFDDFLTSHHSFSNASSHRNPSSAHPSNPYHAQSSSNLPDDDIYVPPHHQPLNPEDEDDVVPDQHAAFGIQRAMERGKRKEVQWRDLGLRELMGKGPGTGEGSGEGKGGAKAGQGRSMPR